MSHMKQSMIEDDGFVTIHPALPEDYTLWSTSELIDDLDRDEAESVFTEFDPDGPYRYTGETDGWWRALKMMDENEVRRLALKAIAQR